MVGVCNNFLLGSITLPETGIKKSLTVSAVARSYFNSDNFMIFFLNDQQQSVFLFFNLSETVSK